MRFYGILLDLSLVGGLEHNIGNVILPIDYYFSEGLKPSTSMCIVDTSPKPLNVVVNMIYLIIVFLDAHRC